MESNSYSIALIGCGFFGTQLAHAFTQAGATLIAVVDIDFQRAENLAAQYQCAAFNDTATMLSAKKPDLVLIATPNYAHYAPAFLALNANCNVFIDTPFALSSAHCRQLCQLGDEKSRRIFIGHLLRTLPGLQRVKAAIEQGKLGKITVCRAIRARWITHLPNKEWWKLDAQLTGGELFHQIHELDLLCWLFGEIDCVFAQSANQAHLDSPDSLDVIQLLFRFKNNLLGSLEMGTAYRLHQWGIQIHGELGAIEVNFFTSSVIFTDAQGKREHIDLFEEFEADLSLRETAKGTQQYNAANTLCPLWLTRAAEIEAQSVMEELRLGNVSALRSHLASAINAAEAAKLSMMTQQVIFVNQ